MILREIHDALAHHGLRHVALLCVGRCLAGGRFAIGQHGAHELAVERVLDLEQRRSDLLERRAVDGLVARHDRAELLRLALDLRARSLEAEHAERVADLLEQLELRAELLDVLHARAHEDIEHVLDRA